MDLSLLLFLYVVEQSSVTRVIALNTRSYVVVYNIKHMSRSDDDKGAQ